MKKYCLLLVPFFACNASQQGISVNKKQQFPSGVQQSIVLMHKAPQSSFLSRHYLAASALSLGSLAVIGYGAYRYLPSLSERFFGGRSNQEYGLNFKNSEEEAEVKLQKTQVDIANLEIENICKNVNPGTFSLNVAEKEKWVNAQQGSPQDLGFPISWSCWNELEYLRFFSSGESKKVADEKTFTKKELFVLRGDAICDVSKLECDPYNNGAVFQVASNGNAYCSITGEVVKPVEFHNDHTQEAYAILPTLPAANWRYNNLIMGNEHTAWQKNLGKQQSLLADKLVCKKEDCNFRFKNGYLALKTNKLEGIQKEFGGEDLVQLCAYHKDAPVVLFKDADDKWYHVPQSTQKVDHIISAAINLGEAVEAPKGFSCGKSLEGNKYAQNIAKKVLETSYEHALLLAAYHGKTKLYLTLLGGGVFANDISWIIEAINKAVKKHAHLLQEMQIFVIDYDCKTDKFLEVEEGNIISYQKISTKEAWNKYKQDHPVEQK